MKNQNNKKTLQIAHWSTSQIPRFISQIFYKHFLTSMCTYVYISVTKWCMEHVHGEICEMSL